MLLEFRLPRINPHMTSATVECVFPQPGDALKMGSKLLDVSVDLGSAFAQECPPISFFRVVMREPMFYRKLLVEPGRQCQPTDLVALLSTEPDEDLGQAVGRVVRITVAGIMHHPGMITGNQA
jgi:hypothetical protein